MSSKSLLPNESWVILHRQPSTLYFSGKSKNPLCSQMVFRLKIAGTPIPRVTWSLLRPLLFVFFSMSVLVLVCPDLAAETIYRWVDETGAVHFSDVPPKSRVGAVEVLEVARLPYAALASSNQYYSVVNQAQRLEEQRLRREKALAEKRKLQAERRWIEEQESVDSLPEAPGTGVYAFPAPSYGSFRPWRPPRIRHRYLENHPAYGSFRPRHPPPSFATQHGIGKPPSRHPAR